jgi:uncharacterized protein YeeX (DUF496 family)
MKKYAIDMQLHMAVKALVTLRGEINCKEDELVKKAELVQEKEKAGEEADYLLEMIFDNLNELVDLFKQKNNLRNQIENLKKIIRDLMKE